MTKRAAIKTIRKDGLLSVSRGAPSPAPAIPTCEVSAGQLPGRSLTAADLIAMARAARAQRRDAGEA